MRLLRFEQGNAADFLPRFKETRLKGFNSARIYADATLSLQKGVDPNNLVPAQRYVLNEDVETILSLEKLFAEKGIDIFALDSVLWFWLEKDGEEEGPIPFTPPIIEMSLSQAGQMVPLINDGMHRVFAARKLGRKINVVLAEDVPSEYPYYAYPLAGGWADVVELAEIPDGFVKKTYRDPDNYKALFRDFNAIFDGIQKQRKKGAAR